MYICIFNNLRRARYLPDFKRYDRYTFSETAGDPTEAQTWVSSIETIFLLMECPDDQKLSCASFMLKNDAELIWRIIEKSLALMRVLFTIGI